MFADALFKDLGTYRKYGDGTIVVHVVFWTTFVDRCVSPILKPNGTIPVAMETLMACARGFAIMIATSLRKPGRTLSSGDLFTLKFVQLDKYLRDSDGYQIKSKFGFRFGLALSRPNEILKPD